MLIGRSSSRSRVVWGTCTKARDKDVNLLTTISNYRRVGTHQPFVCLSSQKAVVKLPGNVSNEKIEVGLPRYVIIMRHL